jgi:RNA polymerase sigma-70 factor (ECF subfamily)
VKQNNDRKEFEQFFNRYYISVLQYCVTMVKDVDDAEDIVQNVFVSIWRKKEAIDIHTSERAYLYKTVYNASLDFLKHEKIKKKYEKERIAVDKQTIHADRIMDNELHRQIEITISKLPEQCGKIFKMSRFENLKYREIAAELNIAEKTVENQMGKALKILRELLKEYLLLLLLLINFYNDK